MKLLWPLLVSSLLLAFQPASAAQKPADPWPPVSQEELKLNDVPGYPGSAAMQLYFSYFKDDNEKFIAVHRRIKVLREAGKHYADVAIPVEPGQSLRKLRARTIHPDGTVIEFSGKPFERIIFKSRGAGKYLANTFTFPDVTVGSIVEYQYLLALPLHIVDQISSWPMASELFTLKEELRFRPFQGLVEVPTERGRFNAKSQVSYTYLNQVKAATPEKQGDTMKLELDNVAPFTREDYMPPEGDYQPAIFFYYGGRETASPDQFWEKWGKILSEWSEGFIGNFAAVRDKSLQLIGNETDPEAKLRKLYAGAQEIRNLSYERDRTAQELKAEGIKENRSVADVLSHGYGTSSDVNRLFVAMARAAGFQSHELRVSDRLERSFSKLVLSLAQLDHQAAEVTVGSNVMVLDPGTKYCPFGLLRWQETGVQALRLSSTAAEFITTPIAVKSVVHRSGKVELLADGTLRGELTVVMDGQEALEHRLEALHTDERGRAKTLEDETTAMLPSGSVVKLLASAGWDSGAGPVTARFSVELPNFAASTGKRLISPSLLLATLQKEMFTTDFRRYPISFMYPFDETDEVSIKLPIGYLPEVLPYRRRATLSYAGYETASSLKDHTLSTSRKLHLDGMLFPPEQFGELKGFFAVVLAGDAGQAILQLDSGEAAGRSSY